MLGPLTYGVLSQSTAAAFTGAYDSIPDLVHLYEIARRGLSSYTGNLVRLRRSSDNAESDFGYVEATGDLDTAAIATWLGGSNGFVVTVYDQLGGNNATQASSGAQPAYVASGQNGRPVMRFAGTGHFVLATFSGALSQPFTVYGAASLDAGAVNDNTSRHMTDGVAPAGRMILRQDSSTSPDSWDIYGGVALNGGTSDSNFNIWAALFNGASSQFWINGTSKASGSAGTHNAAGISIGARYDNAFPWDGDIAMVAIADPSHDDTERGDMEAAINSFWSAF